MCWQVSKQEACDSKITLHYISWDVPKHWCVHPQIWENITNKRKILVTTLPINAELALPLHPKVLKWLNSLSNHWPLAPTTSTHSLLQTHNSLIIRRYKYIILKLLEDLKELKYENNDKLIFPSTLKSKVPLEYVPSIINVMESNCTKWMSQI